MIIYYFYQKGMPISVLEKYKLSSDMFKKELYQTSEFSEEDKRTIVLNLRKVSIDTIIIHNRY